MIEGFSTSVVVVVVVLTNTFIRVLIFLLIADVIAIYEYCHVLI